MLGETVFVDASRSSHSFPTRSVPSVLRCMPPHDDYATVTRGSSASDKTVQRIVSGFCSQWTEQDKAELNRSLQKCFAWPDVHQRALALLDEAEDCSVPAVKLELKILGALYLIEGGGCKINRAKTLVEDAVGSDNSTEIAMVAFSTKCRIRLLNALFAGPNFTETAEWKDVMHWVESIKPQKMLMLELLLEMARVFPSQASLLLDIADRYASEVPQQEVRLSVSFEVAFLRQVAAQRNIIRLAQNLRKNAYDQCFHTFMGIADATEGIIASDACFRACFSLYQRLRFCGNNYKAQRVILQRLMDERLKREVGALVLLSHLAALTDRRMSLDVSRALASAMMHSELPLRESVAHFFIIHELGRFDKGVREKTLANVSAFVRLERLLFLEEHDLIAMYALEALLDAYAGLVCESSSQESLDVAAAQIPFLLKDRVRQMLPVRFKDFNWTPLQQTDSIAINLLDDDEEDEEDGKEE